jgi:hypothetical protein
MRGIARSAAFSILACSITAIPFSPDRFRRDSYHNFSLLGYGPFKRTIVSA